MIAARLAAVAVISLAALGAATAQSKPPKIAEWLPLLPTEVFDHTTEGIEQEEFDILRRKGSSENWKARQVAPNKYVATAKRPFSEVNMTTRLRGNTAFLEVLTFNEKAYDYSYWVPGAKGEPMKAYNPGIVYRALNETESGKPGPAEASTPAEIRDLLLRFEACSQLASSRTEKDSPERKQEIEARMKAQSCADRRQAADAMSKRHAGKTPWPEVIERGFRLTDY